ncbi:hypothetical protein TSOC_012641 [Tetrabaena socialis]|uniref:DM2 domain-containing protein n=1 Tax=Tetrabaena socialis TaxID=47790 RepID=A0A2J7ZMI6_9CHLO|nr:hypothetical protein TSOC_012641 [Tetrabaena socialis]|eukprot:PNH01470.1 hypothetical protein TSOC_012641 [Tetrabaena socialis]
MATIINNNVDLVTPAPEKKVRAPVKAKTAKAKTTATPVPVPEPPIDAAPAVEVSPETAPAPEAEVPLTDRIASRISALTNMITHVETTVAAELKELKAELKAMQKDFVKFQKVVATASSKSNKRKRAKLNADGTEPSRSSGFRKPTFISDQLADFLNISRGTQVPRTEVTKLINAYIKANKLQDPTDGRKLIPNKEFADLLGITMDTELSYFNYQGFLKGQYISTGVVVDTTA